LHSQHPINEKNFAYLLTILPKKKSYLKQIQSHLNLIDLNSIVIQVFFELGNSILNRIRTLFRQETAQPIQKDLQIVLKNISKTVSLI